MSVPRLAFLGLGEMGVRMAQRFIDHGYDIALWNRSAEKMKPFAKTSARCCESPAEAAKGAAFVFLCLLDTKVVNSVVFGASGVVEGLMPEACIVDTSTIDPVWVRNADARLQAQRSARWIDAPVSGGVGGAQAGTLSILCGGPVEDIERLRPVLGVLAKRVTHFGAVGSGLMAKLCNQTIVATHIVAIAEAISLAKHAGLDPLLLVEALQGGWADSTLLGLFGPRFAGRDLPPLGQIYTMLKDADMALNTAHVAGGVMPVLAAAAEVYRATGQSGRLSMICQR